MPNGGGQDAGRRLSQTASSIEIGVAGQFGLLFARGVQPAGEPLDGEVALRCAEAPLARPDGDLDSQSAETLDRGFDRIRAEQATARRQAALVESDLVDLPDEDSDLLDDDSDLLEVSVLVDDEPSDEPEEDEEPLEDEDLAALRLSFR